MRRMIQRVIRRMRVEVEIKAKVVGNEPVEGMRSLLAAQPD